MVLTKRQIMFTVCTPLMKIDRLLALTIYLLNHKKTSASVLAGHFEVSVRTIQRDIETLCLAGIPVTADVGADGGYEILDTFSMEKQVAEQTDYAKIITALEALTSATGDKESQAVLEKVRTVAEAPRKEIIIDLSIAQEGTNISEKLSAVRDAVRAGRKLSFEYTNAQGESKVHVVESVYAVFQWYAWYLIAWYEEKDAYCMFKLIRMGKVLQCEEKCERHHDAAKVRMSLLQQEDTREYFDVVLVCGKNMQVACREYLNAAVVEPPAAEFLAKCDDGHVVMTAHLPKNEHWWYSSLLGFGESVTVLEPPELIARIKSDCEKLVKKYS
jgi:predicted DNA-binding transcriptional regulator YafY